MIFNFGTIAPLVNHLSSGPSMPPDLARPPTFLTSARTASRDASGT